MNGLETQTEGFELDRLQRWMQSIVTHPRGVGSGVASSDALDNINVNLDAIESIVKPSATLSGEERLAIYCRSYHARLLECFHGMFPALLRALGAEVFNLFVLAYLEKYPARSYTLDHLADDFAQHLAETRPDATAPPGEREDWPDFICELAMLEWVFLKIYDGPGVEGRPMPIAQDVLSIPLDRIAEVRVTPAPCLRLFAFRYPVHIYMLAVRRKEEPELPALAQTFLAATRKEHQVKLHELSEAQYAFLKALECSARTVGEVLNEGGSLNDSSSDRITIQNWLCDWTAKGFFESVRVPISATRNYAIQTSKRC